MKLEDLFKKYFDDEEEYEDDPFGEDPDDDDDDDDDDGDDGDDYDDNDDLDDDDDQDEDQDQDDKKDDKDRDRDKDDKDKDDKSDQKDSSDDSSKEGDQSSDTGDGQGEDKGKTDAGQDQEAKDNLDKNIDDKDVENKVGEAQEKEASGAEGHSSSDTGAKNPLEDADTSGLDGQGAGDAGKGAGDAGQGAGDAGQGAGDAGKGAGDAGKGAGDAGKGMGEAGKGMGDAGKGAGEAGKAGGEAMKAGGEAMKAGGEVGKDAAIAGGEGVKDAAVVGGAGGTTAAGGGAAVAGGGGAAAAGGGAAAAGGAGSAAGGGGLISLIGATVPWSLIVIAVIIIIIIIIIIISFFQTLPGSILENLKRTIKQWAANLWANTLETLGVPDNTARITKDQVNDLAKYINDMGYDIQTYGFGDIIVKHSDNNYDSSKDTKNNRVDKEVEDDGETSELKVKSKYLKAYLAADECTYHFRETNFLRKLFDCEGDEQLGLINVHTTGDGWFNDGGDKLKIDRSSESLIMYNHSLDIPVIGFFKKLFTGDRAFKWGEMMRYDLNTWIGRYKRPVELFLALHVATMMPDLTYTIATDGRFNTQVDVHFEPIKVYLRGNLESGTGNDAYMMVNGEKLTARQIILDYFDLFEIKKGLFDSSSENQQDREVWEDFKTSELASAQELWKVFDKLYDKFNDIETFFNTVWNWFVDWKKITLEDYACALYDDDLVFDDWIDLEKEGKAQRHHFYDYFGCGPSTLASAKYPNVNSQWYTDHPDEKKKKGTLIRGSGKFHMSDMRTMVNIWNTDRAGKTDSDGNEYGPAISLSDEDEKWGGEKDPELEIRYIDEGIKLKFRSDIDKDSDAFKEVVTKAYIVYKFSTEDIKDTDLDNMFWPFVSDVKKHWYYKDIDFLGTSEDNATYRLAKVGYKTIQYKTSANSVNYDFQMPCAFYPKTSEKWDFIVYQVAEPVTEGCNENIKNVFSDKYYRYDGTEQTAMMIANTRRIEELKDKGKSEDQIKNGKYTYYYGSEEYDVDLSNTVEKEAVSMPDSPEKALNALAIVKNMHSVSSDYIYRDLKELFVKLEYYTKEEMTEDLKLMMVWPIKVDNKNETFDLVETHDRFGKAIVSHTGAEVIAPMDGTIVECDGGYEIHMDTLNDDDAKLLAFIFKNDFYRINKDALKTMKVRLSGLSLDNSINIGTTSITVKGETKQGAKVKRGQKIGTVNGAQRLSVMIRKNDETVVEDIAEYMREDHNNKYEEIMKRKMLSKDGTLPPIPLRDLFDGTDGGGSGLSTAGYNTDRLGVTVNDAAKAVYQELKAAGYTDEQIAGTLGNIQHESGVISNNLENGYNSGWNVSDATYTSRVDAGTWTSTAFDHRNSEGKGYWSPGGGTFTTDRGGYGLCQWTSEGRKTNLKNKANAKGVSVSDVGIQSQLLHEELDADSTWAGHSDAKNAFRNPGSGEDGVMLATKAFCLGFERPANPEGSMQNRISYALSFYDKIKAGELGSTEVGNANMNDKVSGTTIVWPASKTSKGSNSSRFGYRINPVTNEAEYHHGEDIPGNYGDPIVSATPGVVCGNGWTDARGWYILVFDESTKTKFVYQHMNAQSSLSVGTKVNAGQQIGTIGSTGMSTGPHLHFEIHVNDSNTDTIPWKSGGIADGTVDPKNYNYIGANG